ncbi:MAG: signal peptidase II [Bdellovibrionales bacterium]|nr:signal peptidase II [Bdellovibrionales bacterium]NQZ19280.1 signal peptidase II [Bdellovibrionales bacterium]
MKKKLILLGISSLVILVLDQWTKGYIIKAFQYGESVDVIQHYFNITYVRNYGAAFGFLSTIDASIRDTFFLLMPPFAMTVILFMLKMTPDYDKIRKMALCCVFAGAMGNYIDRLRFGYVVDFLDFHYYGQWAWPAFNVADISIVCGISVLCILEFFPQKEKSTT